MENIFFLKKLSIFEKKIGWQFLDELYLFSLAYL